ncbi:MAG: MFS transporter, partial [Deltaproteobacteria bacterium]|nr:MFS transporter [Deltaproteobacteria bacterium]
MIPQFMLSHFSHHVCTGVLIPILPLLRENFGLNYFQSGILVSCFSLSYGIGQIPMSLLADSFSRRLIIIMGLAGISLTGIGVSLTRAFWQMVPCFIAMGLLGGTYHAPASSFISQVLPQDQRGRALGLHVTGGSASFLLTPIMALGLATLLRSWRSSFFILALPAFIVAILLWFTTEESNGKTGTGREPDTPAHPRAAESNREIKAAQEPIAWLEIIKSIGILVCLAMTLQIVFASVNSYFPLYMVDRHHISPKLAGMVISVIAGAGLFGAPLGGALSDRFGRKQIILCSLAFSGPIFFAITISSFGIPLFLFLILYGLTMSVRMPTMESLIADTVPVGHRTTVLGIYFFLGMETAGVTTPIVGRLIDHFGLDPVFKSLAAG